MAECGGCASARERSGGDEKGKLSPTTSVRYGRLSVIGEFAHDPDLPLTCGSQVIIQTERGIEIGQQVSFTCHGCQRAITREQISSYVKESGADCYAYNCGRILREAKPSDLTEQRYLELETPRKIARCAQFAEELGLSMKVIDAEHIFGGERIVFYFMAEDRIDFRELVRLLAREFQTRIEMRQVGARDEARLLADFETCGRECCCKNFLKNLKPVSMQMAKLQKATLDPSKVSGRCGRLKCCLRFENETYTDLNKKLPRTGRRVRTETDEGVIIDRQILTQLLRIRKDDGTVVTICMEDVVERDLPNPPPPVQQSEVAERPNHGRSEQRSEQSPRGRTHESNHRGGAKEPHRHGGGNGSRGNSSDTDFTAGINSIDSAMVDDVDDVSENAEAVGEAINTEVVNQETAGREAADKAIHSSGAILPTGSQSPSSSQPPQSLSQQSSQSSQPSSQSPKPKGLGRRRGRNRRGRRPPSA